MPFVYGMLMLIFIIVIHESGHAMAARLCGVGVKKFSIGFGPGIVLFRTKTFPVVLAPLMLGGYVSIKSKGMKAEELSEIPGLCLEDASYWKKILIFSAGVIMNLLSAAVILAILFAVYPGERVNFMGVPFTLRNDFTAWYQAPLAAAVGTAQLFFGLLAAFFLAIPKFFMQFAEMAVHLSPRPGVGIIGTMRVTQNAAEAGVPSFLFMAYFFSVVVAAINILPIGMLDGGHILIQTIEKIFGSNKAVKMAQLAIIIFGIAFILVLTLQMFGSDFVDTLRIIKG